MWPFTSSRIFGNRWWALAFVALVCWQVVSCIGPKPVEGSNVAATDAADDAANEEHLRNIIDSLKTL